jgi:hypothetical protein
MGANGSALLGCGWVCNSAHGSALDAYKRVEVLSSPTPFSQYTYCVPTAFVNALPLEYDFNYKHQLLRQLETLCRKSAPETPGGIDIAAFRDIIVQHYGLQLRVKAGRGRFMTLDAITQCSDGIMLISNGDGHTIGLACVSMIAFDADPDVPFPVDLAGPQAAAALAAALGVERCTDKTRVVHFTFTKRVCQGK